QMTYLSFATLSQKSDRSSCSACAVSRPARPSRETNFDPRAASALSSVTHRPSITSRIATPNGPSRPASNEPRTGAAAPPGRSAAALAIGATSSACRPSLRSLSARACPVDGGSAIRPDTGGSACVSRALPVIGAAAIMTQSPPSGGGCHRLRQARQARRIAMPIGHSPGVPGDYVFYVSIQGAKQGKFKGEGAHAHKNVIPAHSFSYEVISPRDVATGQATGKRQHSPVTISKEWGAASPQLFQAAVTNEPLQSV